MARYLILIGVVFIAALIPTAMGTTLGSKIFQPFAITVLSGLTSWVTATLIIIPTIAVALFPAPAKPA